MPGEMTRLARFILRARTGYALGVPNLWRVFLYRLGLRTGLHPVCRLKAILPDGPFFLPANKNHSSLTPVCDRQDHAWYFGWMDQPIDDCPPDWHMNPLTHRRVLAPERPWWKIADFDASTGDIKAVWEASRFDWVLSLACQAATGDSRYLMRLNTWLTDWCQHNPAYCGPNWKCGQEASIRIMHLAMAALLLDQYLGTAPALVTLIHAHLQRIAPTLQYAVAQDNNHATSEAAALFIGGTWLLGNEGGEDAKRWAELGRRRLEERVARLVAPDGSFSQYSINYHRVLLDTLCMTEIWRRALNLPAFSERFQNRCRAAAAWLKTWVEPENGNVPNMGANDGARLLQLSQSEHRDFRPCVRLSDALFQKTAIYPATEDKYLLTRLEIDPPPFMKPEVRFSRIFANGGYVALCGANSWVMIRFANFHFRPGHADCLHLDLWHRGHNILRDGGSYSYHAEPHWLDYFSGTASHNTVQFDDRNQMPRLGRFLFGAWLKMQECTDIIESGGEISWAGAYTDWQQAWHRRTVCVSGDFWRITDDVRGFKNKAVLRWRLMPADWLLNGNACSSRSARITIHSHAPVRRMELVSGWESLYYHQKTELQVLEIEVGPGHCTLETEIHLKA